ncbi:hypothetical protein [Variovorax sp. PAMC 28711]|uniref:hypothetical protein n=1 Tax=Variovorax sp. PAMC 28711 TaxID=1795631 RepID=UPI00078BE89C|nr:hypothetical protein [Variovorax sp. PAMC 28711]AMM22981.1 hypothetical protein AX767_00250 [Variovorax sp. PAMC 28711]
MSQWNETMLLAVMTWPGCAGIFFIACCRLNAMPKHTLFRVVFEYAVWAAIGFGIPMLPFIGEWPGLGTVAVVYAMVVILLCSARAWAGDVAPDEATDVMPIEPLTARQRFDLFIGRARAKALAWWRSLQPWKD